VEIGTLLNLAAGSICAAAGCCIFLLLLNRVLLSLKDGFDKLIIIVGLGVAIVFGSGIAGYVLGPSVALLLPGTILVAIILGELRRAVIRRRCAGSPSVGTETRQVSKRSMVTTMDLAVAHYEVECEAWTGDRLRVAHVSDLHVTDRLPLDYYTEVMNAVGEAQPDLIFFTGDFVTDVKFVGLLPQVLKHSDGHPGKFAVLGNHDYWAGKDEVSHALQSADVKLLNNQSELIPINGEGPVGVFSCEDPWGDHPWRAPQTVQGGLNLVLTHTADNIYRLSDSGFTAVFAGHYHAGQINLPYLGSIVVPSVYGRRFDHGHFVVNGTHLFVTAGVGGMPALRLFCRPDIFIVDFRGNAARRRTS
jgi:uncharacterized protein